MPTTLPEPGDTGVLYVVDLSGFVFRAYHAMPPRITSQGEPVHAVHGTISTLQRLITERRPAYLAVAVDSRGESRRKDRFPEYKANRKDRPPDLEGQVRRVQAIAEAYGIPCLEVEGWEADDIIATLVRGAREAKLRVVIASGDKDLLALVGPDVVMWDGMRDRVFGVEETVERLGVRPDQVTDYLSLVGDSSDNVPGVRGVGPKTAVQLLAEHGTFEGIYANVERIEKKSVREKLITSREQALLSRELVTLNDRLPIPFDVMHLRWGGADMPKLRALFRELEMGWAISALERAHLPAAPVSRATQVAAPIVPAVLPGPANVAPSRRAEETAQGELMLDRSGRAAGAPTTSIGAAFAAPATSSTSEPPATSGAPASGTSSTLAVSSTSGALASSGTSAALATSGTSPALPTSATSGTPATSATPTSAAGSPAPAPTPLVAPPAVPSATRAPSAARARPTWTPPKVALLATLPEVDAFLARASDRGRLAFLSLLDEGDPRHAPIVGIALASGDEAGYAPVGHLYLGRPDPLPLRELATRLATTLASPRVTPISHDDKRERHVFSRAGAPLRLDAARAHDVMLASYLLSAEGHAHDLASIAKAVLHAELPVALLSGRGKTKTRLSELDVETVGAASGAQAQALLWIAEEQAHALDGDALVPLFRELELPLAEVLFGLETRGVAIDVARLGELSASARTRMAVLEKQCHAAAGHPFNVRAPRALEVVLFDELGLPSLRSTKTARSTDADVLEELSPRHALPSLVLELRLLEKLTGTYLDALPQARDPADGRVHPRFNQAVAATGRLSSSEPNLQNIPIRTEEGREIRGAFVAPEGYAILSADYSQIELRVLAHVSRDPELCDAYQRHDDVHVRTAKAIFDVDEQHVTTQMRAAAKTVNFAVIYGQTEVALARNLSISELDAAQYIRAFFQRYAGVARWLDEVVEEARATGAVRTLLGRKREIPDIHARGRMQRWAAERIAKNTPIQGSAADIMKRAMIAVDAVLRGARSRMILTVHDELVLEVHDAERDRIVPAVVHAMERAMQLEVPLVVDYGVGRTWKDAH